MLIYEYHELTNRCCSVLSSRHNEKIQTLFWTVLDIFFNICSPKSKTRLSTGYKATMIQIFSTRLSKTFAISLVHFFTKLKNKSFFALEVQVKLHKKHAQLTPLPVLQLHCLSFFFNSTIIKSRLSFLYIPSCLVV